MPITPFHFGPGLLFRGLSKHVSLSAFVIVNCVIDTEPIVAFLLTGDPMHCFMHTYLGATLAAIATALLARKPVERWLNYWNRKLSPAQARWLGCETVVHLPAFWIGAIIGGWSHVWLDAFMHVDVEPWWPFAGGNSMQGQIDMSVLHLLCVVAGCAGLVVLAWQRLEVVVPRVSGLRKWTGRLLGIGLLLYVGYFYYSLSTGKARVSAICKQITPGMSRDQLVAMAREHGLGLGIPRPEATLVYLAERRSYGRHACRVELENGVVTRSTYNFAD